MNADGDPFKQLKDINIATIKETTDQESLRNIAISSTIAALAAGAISATGGKPSTASGDYDNSKMGMNTVKTTDGKIYLEGMVGQESGLIDVSANGLGDYNCLGGFCSKFDNNQIFKFLNTLPTSPSGVQGHDDYMTAINAGQATKISTAIPYLFLNACASSPGLCAITINYTTDKNYLETNDK